MECSAPLVSGAKRAAYINGCSVIYINNTATQNIAENNGIDIFAKIDTACVLLWNIIAADKKYTRCISRTVSCGKSVCCIVAKAINVADRCTGFVSVMNWCGINIRCFRCTDCRCINIALNYELTARTHFYFLAFINGEIARYIKDRIWADAEVAARLIKGTFNIHNWIIADCCWRSWVAKCTVWIFSRVLKIKLCIVAYNYSLLACFWKINTAEEHNIVTVSNLKSQFVSWYTLVVSWVTDSAKTAAVFKVEHIILLVIARLFSVEVDRIVCILVLTRNCKRFCKICIILADYIGKTYFNFAVSADNKVLGQIFFAVDCKCRWIIAWWICQILIIGLYGIISSACVRIFVIRVRRCKIIIFVLLIKIDAVMISV